MVIQRTIEAAFHFFWRAKIHQPDVDALREQPCDGTQLRRDVVDLGGHHERWHKQQRRVERCTFWCFGRKVVAQRIIFVLAHDFEVCLVGRGKPPFSQQSSRIECTAPCDFPSALQSSKRTLVSLLFRQSYDSYRIPICVTPVS